MLLKCKIYKIIYIGFKRHNRIVTNQKKNPLIYTNSKFDMKFKLNFYFYFETVYSLHFVPQSNLQFTISKL